MLLYRIITSLIGLVVLFGVFGFGNIQVVQIFFVAVVALSCSEVARITIPRLEKLIWAQLPHDSEELGVLSRRIAIILSTLLGLFAFTASSSSSSQAALGIILATIIAAMVIGSFSTNHVEFAVARILGFLFTVCYGALPWISLWNLYLMAEAKALFFLLAVVWAGDTAAYFGGVNLGKRKLAPWLSPKKTIEGSVFGILGSLLAAYVCYEFFLKDHFSLSHLMLAGFFGGLFGQMGDLVESLWKRFCLVKDSGNILPGHGGFLDRVDGLLFAGPIVWFILYMFK